MRVLLIDNGTLYKNKMLKLLSEMEIERVPYQNLNLDLLINQIA
jgi:hypothetical protein